VLRAKCPVVGCANEYWNSLVFHFTEQAPVWGAPGKTAYLILIGLNIEICFMFAIAGIAFGKMLPPDKRARILGVPNRLAIAVGGAAFCVLVEVLLNAIGALTWDYSWWSASAPWLIFLLGYLPFFLVSFWVHDMERAKSKAVTVGAILGFDPVCVIVFGVVPGWLQRPLTAANIWTPGTLRGPGPAPARVRGVVCTWQASQADRRWCAGETPGFDAPPAVKYNSPRNGAETAHYHPDNRFWH
jgi:hypothetical protein